MSGARGTPGGAGQGPGRGNAQDPAGGQENRAGGRWPALLLATGLVASWLAYGWFAGREGLYAAISARLHGTDYGAWTFSPLVAWAVAGAALVALAWASGAIGRILAPEAVQLTTALAIAGLVVVQTVFTLAAVTQAIPALIPVATSSQLTSAPGSVGGQLALCLPALLAPAAGIAGLAVQLIARAAHVARARATWLGVVVVLVVWLLLALAYSIIVSALTGV